MNHFTQALGSLRQYGKFNNLLFRGFLTSILLILFGALSYSQCTSSSSFGTGTVSAVDGGSVTLTSCVFAGAYSTANGLISANSYTITGTGGTGNYLTIRNTSNDLIQAGFSPQIVTNYTGSIRVLVNTNAACGNENVCHTLAVETTVLPPVNDLCSGSLTLSCGDVLTGSTITATNADRPALCVNGPGNGGGVWYILPGNGESITITTCGSDYDTRLNVYSGSCTNLNCVTANDDSPDCGDDELLSSVTFPTSLGTTYYVYVNGFNVLQGNFTLNVTCEPPVVEASIAGSVAWNSSCETRNGVLNLYQPNTNTLAASAAIVVAADGTFAGPSVTIGMYDIIVKVDGYLAKGAQDVVLAAGSNALAVGILTTGDLNGNNVYDISDITLLLGVFNLSSSSPAFNPLADINCSGVIDINDLTLLLAVTFNQSGAVAPL